MLRDPVYWRRLNSHVGEQVVIRKGLEPRSLTYGEASTLPFIVVNEIMPIFSHMAGYRRGWPDREAAKHGTQFIAPEGPSDVRAGHDGIGRQIRPAEGP